MAYHRDAGTLPATAAQLALLRALARQQGIDLAAWLLPRAGTDQPERLEKKEASRLIERLLTAEHDDTRYD